MSAPIVVDQLTRRFGVRRGVTDLSFTVQEGEIFGFLGPNGAGKTTTMRLLMGLLRPTTGAAQIFGLDCWRQATAVKADVAYLSGDVHLYDRLTGEELLDLFMRLRGRRRSPRRKQLVERLEVDLKRPIKHLSKGNRQKIALMQALEVDAPLLILDEPTSGLDPLIEARFVEELTAERARGHTVLLSSHLLTEVERVADRAAILRDGALVAVEHVARLKALRGRRADVALRAPVAARSFTELPGVQVQSCSEGGRRLQLTVRGDLQPLLNLLASLPVDDLTLSEADLESVFLDYYGGAPADGAIR